MKKANARDKILETASRLFQLQGYHATGLNQIIKESGSPKGSLYYYFPKGKEELAIHAVQYTNKYVQVQIKESLNKSSDAAQAIQYFIEELSKQFEHEESIAGMPVGLLAGETALINEPLREVCYAAFQDWEKLFREKMIESGFQEKQAGELAVVITCMIEGGILRSLTEKTSAPLQQIQQQIPVLVRK